MRYILLILALITSGLGCALLWDERPLGVMWLQIGAGFLAVGLATCDLVAAIESGASGERGRRRWQQFRQAARTQDVDQMVQLLTARGVPEDLARRTAMDAVADPDRHRM